MHPEALAWVAKAARVHGPFASVVDAGGRDVNGSPRLLFPNSRYVAVDLSPGPGVDVTADAAQWRPDDPVDLVLSVEVLEHAGDPAALVAAAADCLRPGGRLIVTCATDPRAPHSGVDGGALADGEHYQNIAPEELKGWLADWDDVEIEVHLDRGDLYATAVKP
jgi:SAM-dependent methyltransferase